MRKKKKLYNIVIVYVHKLCYTLIRSKAELKIEKTRNLKSIIALMFDEHSTHSIITFYCLLLPLSGTNNAVADSLLDDGDDNGDGDDNTNDADDDDNLCGVT